MCKYILHTGLCVFLFKFTAVLSEKPASPSDVLLNIEALLYIYIYIYIYILYSSAHTTYMLFIRSPAEHALSCLLLHGAQLTKTLLLYLIRITPTQRLASTHHIFYFACLSPDPSKQTHTSIRMLSAQSNSMHH